MPLLEGVVCDRDLGTPDSALGPSAPPGERLSRKGASVSSFLHSLADGPRRIEWGAVVAGIALALITLVCYRLSIGFATTAFAFFVVVILHSLVGVFFTSALISIAASASLDYFFLPPVFSFRVNAPLDALGLATFLLTSFTINSLSYRLKQQARAASEQRDIVARLYEAAQRLLAQEPSQIDNEQALAVFLNTFQLQAICLYEGASDRFHEAGRSDAEMQRRAKEVYLTGKGTADAAAGECYLCLPSTTGAAGAIGFRGLRAAPLIAGPLTALVALTMERARASRSANHSAARAESEALRATVLDGLAHEFKTPLSTILAAAGGLREFGPLSPTQMEFAQIVETEATRLGRLTTRLLRTAKLESDELKPKMTDIDLEQLVLGVVKRYSKLAPERRFATMTYGDVGQVKADPELLRLALSQLLDNATKYSTHQSPIEIEMERREDRVSINVWNSGSPIPESERELVFERFYRGVECQDGPSGTGLGLHVARRIAIAHSGDVVYEAVGGKRPAVVFRIQIPVPQPLRKQ